jgi:hypothetical protein
MIRVVGLGSGIARRCAGLLSVAVLLGLLALPALALGGETAPGSTETLALEASNEREVGEPMTVTVEGTVDGLHRLFVYGEADVGGGCAAWPYEEPAHKGAVTLTSAEGEPLSAGHFFKSFVVVPASASAYGVCAYLDATPSANPDVFEDGCYVIPATPTDNVNCLMPYTPWWVIASLEKGAREQLAKAQAERRSHEEALARGAREEAERRQAIEAVARRSREEGERYQREANQAKAQRCAVPQLRRHTLAGVRRLLRDADCRLGKVTTRHHGHGTLVVKSQNPQHGKTLLPGSAVSIVLGLRAG